MSQNVLIPRGREVIITLYYPQSISQPQLETLTIIARIIINIRTTSYCCGLNAWIVSILVLNAPPIWWYLKMEVWSTIKVFWDIDAIKELILDFQPPQVWEINYHYLNHLVWASCLWLPPQNKTATQSPQIVQWWEWWPELCFHRPNVHCRLWNSGSAHLPLKAPGLHSAPHQIEHLDSTASEHDISTLTATIYYSLEFGNRQQNFMKLQNTANLS